MIGHLHPDEVEDVLHRQHVGRLACIANDRPYVVPVTYTYTGGDLYGRALSGRKLAALRTNPRVCFEVDEQERNETWNSVLAEGIFEEVTDPVELRAARALLDETKPTVLPTLIDAQSIIFRVQLTDKSGRFARQER